VKATRPQLEKALKNPSATRLFLLHGPDEAGSQALAKRVGPATGPDAERINLTGAELKNDPARLADEAAALSMFGGARWILVSPVGDEAVDAAAALLEAPAAGNPVVLVAGALKATSKLLKLVTAASNALAFASYPPDARDFGRLVAELARARGLAIQPDDAHRLAEAAGANRAIVEQELEKIALYLDAAPGRSVTVDHEVIASVGAALDEGDAGQLVDHLFGGRPRDAQAELGRLRGEGVEGITLIRAAVRRALLLAKLRAGVEQGRSPSAVMESQGKSLFWKEKDAIGRQLASWDAATLARCVTRLQAAERDVKRSGGIGPLAAEAELLAIARQAARRN
jgi:DNA polymerase III subunit delta